MSIFNGKMKNFDKDAPGAQSQRIRGKDIIGGFIAPQAYANQGNMQLAQYQWSKDLEMWNRQNAYNTPLAQMERYQAAGLNPNLVVSQGSSGNANQMPHYQAPTISYDQKIPMITNVLQTFADLDIKQAQADNIRAQTRGVMDNNELTQIQKIYWAQNEFNKAQKLYNDGVISARTKDRLQREFELLFNGKLIEGEGGSYKWIFGDDSYFQLTRENELLRHNADMALAKQKQEQNQKFMDYFDANMVMRLLGNFVGLFK